MQRYAGRATDDGRIVAYHVRVGDGVGKKVWWERPGGAKGLGGFQLTDLALYGAADLAADASTVVVTEGEKARDSLHARGVAAVGTMTGASAIPCDAALAALLPHETVVLWADNDEPGVSHMNAIAARLKALGHQDVRYITWPGQPPKADAADFTGTDGELSVLVATAVPFDSPPTVDLAALLDAVTETLARYVVLTAAQRDAIALWIAHTHAFGAADSTPYLAIYSPDKRCGKTRLLEVLEGLVAQPWLTGRVSAAALVRKIDAGCPTLLLDESDAAFNGDRDYAEVLRGVLNSGHRRGGCVSVCVGQNSNFVVKDFSAFSPKAIAGIGKLPDTVADRSIPITMRRKGKNEPVERFRYRMVQTVTAVLRAQFETWALAATPRLTVSEPILPPELNDRAGDGWEPLLAIADAAGGSWPLRARTAALELSAGIEVEDESYGVRMLSDIRDVFAEFGDGEYIVASTTLVGLLKGIGEAPWSTWSRGRGLDESSLAKLLRPYDIRPTKKRDSNSTTVRGYETADFEDAWERYLAPRPPCSGEPEQVEHPEQQAFPDSKEVPAEAASESAQSASKEIPNAGSGVSDALLDVRLDEAEQPVASQLSFVPPVPLVPLPAGMEAAAPNGDRALTQASDAEPPTTCYVCGDAVTAVGRAGTGFCEQHLPAALRCV
jgi:hypothetical protein